MNNNFNYKFVSKKMKEKKLTRQQLADYLTKNGIDTTFGVVTSWFRSNLASRRSPEMKKWKYIAKFIDENIETLFTDSEKTKSPTITLNSNNQINGNNNNMIFGSSNHNDKIINLVQNNEKIREVLELYIDYGNESVLSSFVAKLKELKKISESF